MSKTIHSGSCHCGKVRFEVAGDMHQVRRCNCSICTKKGVLHWRVSAEQFTLLSGNDALTLYQSGTRIAKHFFCRYCGIHPFSHPRSAPDMYSINVHCLDDVDLERPAWKEEHFDGKNWEEAFKKSIGS
ncbi:MAG: GFA family protein [Magnetococcus sp. DMHC-1]